MAKRKKKSKVPPSKRRAGVKKKAPARRLSRRELERRQLAAKKRRIARKKAASLRAYWERVRQIAREYNTGLAQARQIYLLFVPPYERKTPLDAITEIRAMEPGSIVHVKTPFMEYRGEQRFFDVPAFWKRGGEYYAGTLPRSKDGRDDYWKLVPIVRAKIKIDFKRGIIKRYTFEIPIRRDAIFAIFQKEVHF